MAADRVNDRTDWASVGRGQPAGWGRYHARAAGEREGSPR